VELASGVGRSIRGDWSDAYDHGLGSIEKFNRLRKMNGKKVAVFDIDGTVFRSSLLIELVEELIADGIFPESTRKVYNRAHKRWLDREDSYEKYINAVVKAFDSHIKGVVESDLLAAAKRVVEFHKHRVYRYTRDLIRHLKKEDYFLLAISHSPKYIVHDFAKGLGFDKVYGRLLELDRNKKFTGQAFEVELISDKSKIFKRAVEKENLILKGSIGVGDTESDVAFLEMVERPICFNPNRPLYTVARKRDWLIVVERKDVIYTIKD
jgi:HAD superfamily hydrolase (TIGR01490 family)